MQNIAPPLIFLCAVFAFASCATPKPQVTPNPLTASVLPGNRKLMVFFDGTSNEWRARTNVRRFFELAAAPEDPMRRCFWIEGVGTETIMGKALGHGMKPRIMSAYEFLARNYRVGDEIYVFGFSRGAFQARALCGMLAHCGLYEMKAGLNQRIALRDEPIPSDEIWKLCRELPEEPQVGPDSERDFWSSLGSDEKPRKLPKGAAVHASFLNRVRHQGPLWESVKGSKGPWEEQRYQPKLIVEEITPGGGRTVLPVEFWNENVFDEKHDSATCTRGNRVFLRTCFTLETSENARSNGGPR
jgi:hypothetical protein